MVSVARGVEPERGGRNVVGPSGVVQPAMQDTSQTREFERLPRMNRKVVRLLIGLVIGIAVLAVVGVVAYNYGASGHNSPVTFFGPMRGYGRGMGWDGWGFGLWGLIPLLLFGLLVFVLFSWLLSGPSRPASMPPTPPQGPTGDGLDGLRQLSEMHSRGELTDEEFTAAKRRLLGL
jgi:uncharacterized membrane protein